MKMLRFKPYLLNYKIRYYKELMEQSLVCVIIVTWNNANDIRDCLNSIKDQDYINYKILVIDNASNDKTAWIIENEFPNIELKTMSENLFLVKANNFGIEYCIKNYNPSYLMVLNPDTKASTNLVSTLVSKLEQNPNVAAVGPKVLFWNNKNEGLINSAGLIYDGFNQAYDIGFMQEDKGQFNKDKEVFGVTGASILYRAKIFKDVGLFWERIKLHLDEVELFIRIHKKGWKVIYTPDAILYHKYMQSTDQNKQYKIESAKKKVWLWIALRHYPIKSKLAMIKHYLTTK